MCIGVCRGRGLPVLILTGVECVLGSAPLFLGGPSPIRSTEIIKDPLVMLSSPGLYKVQYLKGGQDNWMVNAP